MCGIAGIWIKKQYRNTQELSAMCRRMADSIVHRGPDDEGVWCDAEAGLFFSHRRLSILDLSPAGHQPMTSHDGRYVIVYNGEIYNHHNIRAELDSISPNIWRGTSDTETMLEAIAVWGIEKALERFNGMFAFALWDRLKRELTLARDRFGEKPLYYGWLGDCFTFASELKAIRIAGMALKCPSSVFELDPEALGLFVRYQYVPTPWSIYKGIRKLPPAHIIKIPHGARQNAISIPYWNLSDVVRHGIENPFAGNLQEGIEELESRLKTAVGFRMEADVPLGAFLSGGIDSSAIVAMMQAQATSSVKTFTIAFPEARYDESGPAREVAANLGTDHTELSVTPKDALDVIPRLAYVYDEPFADASQIPTCLLSRLTRRNVTVALSGDGADELLGGYYRHFMAPILWKRLAGLPHPLRQAAAAIAYHLPESLCHNFFAVATKVGGKSWRTAKSAGRIQKLFNILQAPTADVMYRNLLTYWKNPQRLFENGVTVENPVTDLTKGLPVLQNNLGSVDDITCRIMRVHFVFVDRLNLPKRLDESC